MTESTDTKGPTSLRDPLIIGAQGGLRLRNRLYRAPVLEGAGGAKNPAKVYAKHFVPNVEAGLGLVIQGNTIVLPEGRTSPGMTAIATKADMMAMQPLTEAIHAAGGRIVLQLGHGGIYAIESWHRAHREARKQKPLAVSRLPFWLRMVLGGQFHVCSTAEVADLVERFGVVAAWAREAGYDGVQLAGGNAKFLHQFLSPVYNRRDDRYGGDLVGRTTILREIRAAIAQEAGADFPVLLKYPAVERGPFGGGISLDDGVRIGQIAAEAGFDALTPVNADVLPNTAICRGDYPATSLDQPKIRQRLLDATGGSLKMAGVTWGMWFAARKYPFVPLWNRDVCRAVKAAVDIPVFAVGGIRTPAEASMLLAAGEADLIGIGRPFYAEPQLAARFLAHQPDEAPFPAMACENCNRCIIPQMLGLPGVCYNPASNQRKHELASSAPTKS